MLRGVFNEGTAQGQKSWAGTSQATLASVQHVINLLAQQVIPRLGNVFLAPTNETASLSISGSDQNMGDQAGIGLQMLERAETEEERLVEDPPQIDVTTTKSSVRWWNVGSTLNACHNAH